MGKGGGGVAAAVQTSGASPEASMPESAKGDHVPTQLMGPHLDLLEAARMGRSGPSSLVEHGADDNATDPRQSLNFAEFHQLQAKNIGVDTNLNDRPYQMDTLTADMAIPQSTLSPAKLDNFSKL